MLLDNTKAGIMYGGWNGYGRLFSNSKLDKGENEKCIFTKQKS